jgi:hypothetical protein
MIGQFPQTNLAEALDTDKSNNSKNSKLDKNSYRLIPSKMQQLYSFLSHEQLL